MNKSFHEKWVITYTEVDGERSMGMATTYEDLPKIIQFILSKNGKDIVIEDYSVRLQDNKFIINGKKNELA